MTDTEIKIALQCCNDRDGRECGNCPLNSEQYCIETLCKEAFDLNCRLEAEAAKYYNIAKNQQAVSMERYFEILRLKEDNERLKKLLAEEEEKYELCAKKYYIVGAEDFAERLKRYSRKVMGCDWSGDFWEYAVLVTDIDSLLKEMMGEG